MKDFLSGVLAMFIGVLLTIVPIGIDSTAPLEETMLFRAEYMFLGVVVLILGIVGVLVVNRIKAMRKIKPHLRTNGTYRELEDDLVQMEVLSVNPPKTSPPVHFCLRRLIELLGLRLAAEVTGSVIHHYNAEDKRGKAILGDVARELYSFFLRPWKRWSFMKWSCLRHQDVGGKLAPFMSRENDLLVQDIHAFKAWLRQQCQSIKDKFRSCICE